MPGRDLSRSTFLRGAAGLAGMGWATAGGTRVAAQPAGLVDPRKPSLEERLARLEDERDIRLTLERYSHSIDARRVSAWVDNFTPDGIFDMRTIPFSEAYQQQFIRQYPFGEPHAKGFRFVGHAALKGFIGDGSGTAIRRHASMDHVITRDADPDIAHSTSYFILVRLIGEELKVASFGSYVDRLRRGADGHWRIAERICEMEGMPPAPKPA